MCLFKHGALCIKRSALLKHGGRGGLKGCDLFKHGGQTWWTLASKEAPLLRVAGTSPARLPALRPWLKFPEAHSARCPEGPALFGARDLGTPLCDWPRGGDVRRSGGAR